VAELGAPNPDGSGNTVYPCVYVTSLMGAAATLASLAHTLA